MSAFALPRPPDSRCRSCDAIVQPVPMLLCQSIIEALADALATDKPWLIFECPNCGARGYADGEPFQPIEGQP